jgi:hypothetical protein
MVYAIPMKKYKLGPEKLGKNVFSVFPFAFFYEVSHIADIGEMK